MRKLLTAALVTVFLLGASTISLEAANRDTLKEIEKRGRIIVGHRESSVPFAYVLPRAAPALSSLESAPTPVAVSQPSEEAPAPVAASQPSEEAPAPVAASQPSEEASAPVAASQPSEEAPAPVAASQPSEEAPAPVAASQPSEEAPAPVAVSQPSEEAPAPVAASQPTGEQATPKFSHQEPQVVGYSIDYASHIIEAIKKELNNPDLEVEFILVTPQNRLQLLAEGAYDFECGATTNTTLRQKEAAFSNTIFVASSRILTGKNAGIKNYPDLRGKTMAVAEGTTTARLIELMDKAENLNLTLVPAANQSEAFKLVEAGQADALFLDDALLAGERSKALNPDDWVIVGEPQTFEAYGCLLPQGDTRFKKLVDRTIASLQQSGEALSIYKKWFQSPIPPKGLVLGLELSGPMKHLFQNPNDEPYQ